jgi:hypothetical protein
MKKDKTLSQLVGDYANLELEVIQYNDCIRPEIGYIEHRSEKPYYKYTLMMDWLDGSKYAIMTEITQEAIDDIKFDILEMEIDKMIGMFIKKLEEVTDEKENEIQRYRI